MKAKIRKTGELVEIISYTGNTIRNEVLDSVSYIDSKGNEHPREKLNFYWDFEIIQGASAKSIEDWPQVINQTVMGAMQVIQASPHITNSIGYAIQYYHQYMLLCDNLAKRANELIEGTHLAEYIVDDISCEYSPGIGLFFVVDMNDKEVPHNINCLSFFELFERNIDEITIQDLKMLSL